MIFHLDIDDCNPNPCFTSVSCKDMSAPRRGYSCGSCPRPMIGDGISCSMPTFIPCPSTVRCFPGVECLLLPGDRVLCGPCPQGMQGDGLICEPQCTDPAVCQTTKPSKSKIIRHRQPSCKRSCRY